MNKITALIIFGTIIFETFVSKAQQAFYNLGNIQKIEINFPQPNWDYQLDTSKTGADKYLLATWVKINGVQLDSVGVKYKGNSSYDSTYIKNPLHIAIDKFKSQNYQGISDIKLGNGYADPSMIREVLSYQILKNYMFCPEANFAQVYVNGAYVGLYSNIESIGKKFCNTHFYSSQNTLIKCNPIVTPGPTTKCSLRYLPLADTTGYYNFYDMKSNYGWNDLKNLCDSVSNNAGSVAKVVDLDRFIWMLAYNNVLVNLDSYSGVFSQNYYLYKDNTGHFNPIIWDLNMSLGGFPYAGSGANSLGSLTIANMQQLPLALHGNDANWPIIKIIMNNAMYKRMYVAHMRTILTEFFASNNYQTIATTMQALIDTAVVSDVNKFYSYNHFQNALTTDNPVGNYNVPGISNLMNARVTYLQSTPEFMATPPVISNVISNNQNPNLNSIATITATVTNANAVYLAYRCNITDKFIRVLMFDDGAHNDGAANDSVYGATLVIQSSMVQYYVYAENNNAGTFSPARAEHEYYMMQALQQNLAAGDIVINEFAANNVTGNTNENGTHEDWIELYNNTNFAVDLNGLYLTDSINIPAKFAFAANTIIQPHAYLTLWADNNNSTSTNVHCNFKLSSNGESLMLSNGAGFVIDSTSFGAQTADISIARCPNGTGDFAVNTTPSFNASNCVDGILENENSTLSFTLLPNPSNDFVIINCTLNSAKTVIITDALGKIVYTEFTNSNSIKVNTTTYQNGIYFVKIGTENKRLIVIR